MRFQFLQDDKNLTKAGKLGGCGLTAQEIESVTRWQNNLTYEFELHLENHGPYIYIFPEDRKPGQKNMPRYYFGGGKAGEFDNDKDLKSAVKTDLKAVVDGNIEIFKKIHDRFYGNGEVVAVPAAATVICGQCQHSFVRPPAAAIVNEMTPCPAHNCSNNYVYVG